MSVDGAADATFRVTKIREGKTIGKGLEVDFKKLMSLPSGKPAPSPQDCVRRYVGLGGTIRVQGTEAVLERPDETRTEITDMTVTRAQLGFGQSVQPQPNNPDAS